MSYSVVVFKVTGEIERTVQPKAPDLAQMQKVVGGYIESIVHFTKYDGMKRGSAFCNENGIAEGLPFNINATQAWLAALGPGPFRYEPRLMGNVIFYSKQKG